MWTAPTRLPGLRRRATTTRIATIDGVPGAVWAPRGNARTVFAMRVHSGRIRAIEMIGNRLHIADLDISFG